MCLKICTKLQMVYWRKWIKLCYCQQQRLLYEDKCNIKFIWLCKFNEGLYSQQHQCHKPLAIWCFTVLLWPGGLGLPSLCLWEVREEDLVRHWSVLDVNCWLPGLVLPLLFSMANLDSPGKSRKYSTKELASGRWGKNHPFDILNQVKRSLLRPSRLISQQH